MKARANLGWSAVGAVTALLLAVLWVFPLLWAASTALRPELPAISRADSSGVSTGLVTPRLRTVVA